MSFCTVCKATKEAAEFYRDNRRGCGFRRECKACTKVLYTAWKDRNPNKYKAHNKRSNLKHGRISHLKYTYGITPTQYDELVAFQNGVCAICFQKEKIHRYLLVDHDHGTGKVRGLLCSNCNVGLGRFSDNYNLLLKAVEYIRKHDAILS